MAGGSTRRSVPPIASSSKRSATENLTPTRQSKRTKLQSATKTTPQKSRYFEEATSDEEEVDEDVDEGSGYEENEADGEPPSEANSEEDDVSSDEDSTNKKAAKRTKASTTSLKRAANGSDSVGDSGLKLVPGTQLIIKKPKAREAGSTPYRDDTLHPNTMLFLTDLAKNNDRSWLKMHDPDYRQSLQDFNSFLECLTQEVIQADETIPELPVKDIIFRIYRDVRFSKNPTPYKTHFSAAWSRTGRKGPYAGYYVQIQPGKSFVGAGVWQPEPDKLAALRRDVDRGPSRLKSVLLEERLRSEVLGVNSRDAKKVIKAFVSQGMNKESALKTKPKGYENDHENIELLRLRNYTVGKKLSDKEVLGPSGLRRISHLISCMVPFVTYLNSTVMPDEPESSSEDNDDSVGEGEDEEVEGQTQDDNSDS